jgi:hypothetical protein
MYKVIYSLVIAVLLLAAPPVGAGIPVEVPCDFVTGGGFIVRSTTGAKANFGVGGGFKNEAFWGHLEYNDHSTRPPLRVHGTGVTSYMQGAQPNSRIIMGTARINGVDGSYTVEVVDNQEPGRGIDEFSIALSDGYTAGTEFGDGPIQGGNIRLHPGNESNTPPPSLVCQDD